jgi:DUF4097 and DUF4098 domain-containing protein YvlB
MKRFLMYAAIAVPIFAQEHIAVPLADPSRPVSMSIRLVHGSVTVRAYSGREVVVDTKGEPAGSQETTHDGMHRIGGTGSDLSIESDNNKVNISSHGMFRGTELTVQTPVNTSVSVKTLSGGEILIEGVSGEIEAQNLNGAVAIRNVSGSVVAHSLNGAVTVTMSGVKSGSPMSFSSLNGTIDVTLPPNVAADFSMKTNRGEIYSDFDVKLKSPVKPVVEESDSKKGKYKVKTDGAVLGAVNGGGPEFKFTTLNGNIYIRKAK